MSLYVDTQRGCLSSTQKSAEQAGLCPYSGCHFNCQSEYHHRARFAYISENRKKKVRMIDKEMEEKKGKGCSPKVNWDKLKELGIIYP